MLSLNLVRFIGGIESISVPQRFRVVRARPTARRHAAFLSTRPLHRTFRLRCARRHRARLRRWSTPECRGSAEGSHRSSLRRTTPAGSALSRPRPRPATIGAVAGRRPAGRMPDDLNRYGQRLTVPPRVLLGDGVLHRLPELLFECAQRTRVARSEIDLHPRLAGDRVDRRAAADAPDVERRPRRVRHLKFADARDSAAEGVDRVDGAERTEAVAAGPLNVTRNRALPIAMCVMPRPSPSIETNRSILSFNVSLNSRLTPRRSPSPSSPTVPTNVIVPGVVTPPLFNARATANTSASPRQSSPMPGPRSA